MKFFTTSGGSTLTRALALAALVLPIMADSSSRSVDEKPTAFPPAGRETDSYNAFRVRYNVDLNSNNKAVINENSLDNHGNTKLIKNNRLVIDESTVDNKEQSNLEKSEHSGLKNNPDVKVDIKGNRMVVNQQTSTDDKRRQSHASTNPSLYPGPNFSPKDKKQVIQAFTDGQNHNKKQVTQGSEVKILPY